MQHPGNGERVEVDDRRQFEFVGPLTAMVLMLSVPAQAQETGNEDQLRMLGRCQGCNFEGLDLVGRKLTGIDLTEAILEDVDLEDAALNIAIFDYAVLRNVSFEGADLSGASFRGARLVDVSFEDAELQAAVFEDAILENTDIGAGRLCNTQMPNENRNSSECG